MRGSCGRAAGRASGKAVGRICAPGRGGSF
uniref:Uncharacterized protein n=1 Tax=Arundo donax TaxID=35708 RepID=A0A0A9G0N2_ARUDO